MRSNAFRVRYAGILGLLGATALFLYLVPGNRPEQLERSLAGISGEIVGWQMTSVEHMNVSASAYIARTYTKDGDELQVLVAYHDNHRGSINVHSPKNCLPGDGWEILQSKSVSVIFDGRPARINEYHIYRLGRRATVLFWYQSRGRVTANEYVAKLMLIRDGLKDGRTSGALVRIVLPDRSGANSEGYRFAEALMREVQLCFRS